VSRDEGEPAIELVAARVTKAERSAIEALAERHDRSASREVRRAIRFYLARFDEAQALLSKAGPGGDQ
jgi:hypothetical protein